MLSSSFAHKLGLIPPVPGERDENSNFQGCPFVSTTQKVCELKIPVHVAQGLRRTLSAEVLQVLDNLIPGCITPRSGAPSRQCGTPSRPCGTGTTPPAPGSPSKT